jgi:hypothetical protein
MGLRLRAPQFRRDSVRAVGALIAIVIALASAPAMAQEPILWGSLKPGVYAVGFRTLYRLDHTRQYDPEYPTDPMKPPAHRPRPILICIWYPAKATTAKTIAYREYLDVPSDDPRVAPFARRLMPHVRDVVCSETIGKNTTALRPDEAAAFESFLDLKTFAMKDAQAADGQFPVVIVSPIGKIL